MSLRCVPLVQQFHQRAAETRRRGRDLDARCLHRGDLVLRAALAAGDDGAGVAHAATRRRGAAGDESDNRLRAALLRLGGNERRGFLLGRAADLADHDDRFSRRIGEEEVEHLDELRAFDRVAANADRGGLAEAGARRLEHRFVGQRPGTRHDSDRAPLEDVARHDADLAFVRGHHAGTVRSDEARGGAGERPLDLDHVEDGDAFGDAHDQRDPGGNGLADRIGGAGRRHVDDGRIGAGLLARLGDGVEHWQVEMSRAALARRDAADHLRAIGDGLLGVKGAGLAGEALADDLGVPVDQNGHQARPPAVLMALTIFWAASSRSSAAITSSPDSFTIFLPSSTLVPSSRTTSGTARPTSFTAAMTPSAMTSQRMMPPKMFTRMPFTFGSAVMILKAAVTFSFDALPPTSRKLAGASP